MRASGITVRLFFNRYLSIKLAAENNKTKAKWIKIG
jgi:hypothetical protein